METPYPPQFPGKQGWHAHYLNCVNGRGWAVPILFRVLYLWLGYQVCVSVGLSSVCVGCQVCVCVGLSGVCVCWVIKCVCWLLGVCVGLSGVCECWVIRCVCLVV